MQVLQLRKSLPRQRSDAAISPAPDAWCAGFAYLPKATQAFLAQACEQGAQVHYNSPVLSLQRGPSQRVTSRPPKGLGFRVQGLGSAASAHRARLSAWM